MSCRKRLLSEQGDYADALGIYTNDDDGLPKRTKTGNYIMREPEADERQAISSLRRLESIRRRSFTFLTTYVRCITSHSAFFLSIQ